MQLFSAWLGRRTGHRRQIIVFGALVQASTLVPLTLLPLLFPDDAVLLLLISSIVYYAGPNLGSPQWSSLMGDIVPEARRGRFFALRTQLASVASFLALIAGGLILEFFDSVGVTYWGFVVVFAIACLARFQSAYHLSQIHDPPGHVASLESPWHIDLWRAIRSTDLVPFSLFFASMQFAVGIASPFFTLYMLRDLHFSYVAVHDQLRGIRAAAVSHAEPVGPPERSVRQPADPDHHRRDHSDHADAVAVLDQLLLSARRAVRERAGVGRLQS